jgi:acyl dehydratase
MAQGLTMVHSGKKYFEDISVGDHSESGEQHVDKDEMLDFARRYDPQYFHTDPEAAKASVFGEVVASITRSAGISPGFAESRGRTLVGPRP